MALDHVRALFLETVSLALDPVFQAVPYLVHACLALVSDVVQLVPPVPVLRGQGVLLLFLVSLTDHTQALLVPRYELLLGLAQLVLLPLVYAAQLPLVLGQNALDLGL